MLKLIVEDNDYSRATVVESTEDELKYDRYHPLMMRGIFARANSLTKNRRFYPFDMLKREMDKFIHDQVERGIATGEFEHPTEVETKPERVACKITKLTLDEHRKCWLGEARILYTDEKHNVKGTPKGDLAKSFIDASIPLGFSTRGCGELNKYNGSLDGIDTSNCSNEDLKDVSVVSPYVITTIDLVSNPAVGVFCEGILESKQFMIDVHGRIVECAFKDYEKALAQSTYTNITEKKQKIYNDAFDAFLKKIG
jgi:hypothetical protein